MFRRVSHFIVAVLAFIPARSSMAQSAGAAGLRTGKEIYQAGCAGCHGSNGTGAPQATIGFEKPDTFPDFTECDQTTPEDNLAWRAIIRDGGPQRGFSPIMPSFSGALTSQQIDAVIEYLRGLCKEKSWPRGELNLPRSLVTEKAFPENEDVITTALNANGSPGVSSTIVHEQRIGIRNQIEVSVPIEFQHPEPGLWYGGPGDIGLGLKHILLSSLRAGSILSVQGEAILPSGNRLRGLGSGVTTFETFATYGQLLPAKTFLQVQGGAELPVNTSKVPDAVYFRTALGKSFNEARGVGRLWSPMVELLADRDLNDGARTNWDVVPEFQVTLSKRQHVRFNLGLRVPAMNTTGRHMRLLFYFLWDRQDGLLREGW